jgi:hypothetical protein
VTGRTGAILRNPADLTGPRTLPAISSGAPYVDLDEDGMADNWERAHGMNPMRNDAWQDTDHNGWANLDEFLDFAHRERLAGREVR